MPEQHVIPRLLSKKGAANYTGVSPRTVNTWIAEQCVATRKVGGRRLIEKDSLDAFIDRADRTPAKKEGEARELIREIRALRRQMEKTGAYPRWMRLTSASRHCGLSTRTLERRIKEGCFSTKGVGATRLIDRESLDAWIASQPECGQGFRGRSRSSGNESAP